ncbi:Dolichyl-phosphate-mannose-protein mannosyltransferase [Celeribacter baekdonensis]|uniref:Dolichyl-phosphate-mannose-protein mannosyltransferase n=1 Tax=Celeribacter baekdonensis TaxID=875171 RepID=A0A1G7M4N4_9RHOB|nr:glycosyltransferase family 39 protein [Celeribacter baekdonensis]SDF56604.1 Dolichyl-phosphate-mannose-protein mannosyltransferase [Celeribacter baekdonensis]
MRQDRLFIWIIAAYFAAHTVLRTILGGSFEVDEAEMFVMAQEVHLGYGPQAPLYNWVQAGAFALFGANTFAVAATKNLLLFVTYALFFDGLRRVIPPQTAVLGTLALLLLPNVSWEGQRAGSHSIAMLTTMAATFWVMARQIETPKPWHPIALGVALGLGGIAKFNFWLFPLTLFLSALTVPSIRARLMWRTLWHTGLVAALILIAPMAWMILHSDQTMASAYKFYYPPKYETLPTWLAGLVEYGVQTLAALALLLLVLIGARLAQGRAALRFGPAMPVSLWLMRAGMIGLGFGALAVVAFGVTDVQPRWLLPMLMPLSIGLMIWVMQNLGPRTKRALLGVCAALAVLILAAMADTRLRGAGSDSMRVDVLAQAIAADLPEGPVAVISGNYYFVGNLKYHRPDWQALAPLPNRVPAPGTVAVVLVGGDMIARSEAVLAEHGITPETVAKVTEHSAILPYRFEDVKTIDVPYAIVELKNGAE